VSDARRALVARTALLRGVGPEAIDRLAAARVLVVGAGGLGSPVIALLAGSGIGRLTIVDPDVIDPTNLSRQTLFTAADVGAPKAELAVARARAVDPALDAVAVVGRFDATRTAGHDIVVDAADDFAVTRSISDACADAGLPFVWGSVLGFDGQTSVFHDAHGIDFHDLYPSDPAEAGSCEVDGVLPALCQAVGSVMAAQVLAVTAGIGEPLLGAVLSVDATAWTWRRSVLRRGRASVRPTPLAGTEPAERITVTELLVDRQRLTLVDVRTPAERSVDSIPGSITPDQLAVDALDVVVICERGPRADAWVARNGADLRGRVRVLDGGMQSWRATSS
jgi:molybdopterin/thiamine biosynthesis adenylyltransferase/rhodanese-related sulfurtransferase